ncbi:MAG: LysR substrate-binding domain-containing protein [Burkholderiaceae bacterium]
MAAACELAGKPVGTVRITATDHAVDAIIWPRLLPWLPHYPEIKIEVSSDNQFVDIVSDRFDIGVRLGDDVAKDMIAVRIAPDLRIAVVASPAYFRRRAPPRSPQDLADHDCIRLRLPTHGGVLPWEFKREERTLNAHVSGRLVFNRNDLIIEAALAGYGLAWLPIDIARTYVHAGLVVTTLEDWAISYPGYHLYYASRRVSPALTLVVDALRPV